MSHLSPDFIAQQRKLYIADCRSRGSSIVCEVGWRGWLACLEAQFASAAKEPTSQSISCGGGASDASVPEGVKASGQ